MRTEKEFLEYLDTIKKIAEDEGFDSLDETYVEHLRARFFGEDVVIGKTLRVTLREMKVSDLEAFYGFWDTMNEPVLQAFIKETPYASKAHLQSYIENMYPMYDYGIWTVEMSDTGEIIGLCGLGQVTIDGEICTDLGYYICPKWRNQGLASECIEFVLDYAKNYLEFPVIYAIIKEENRISASILRKFGFQCIKMCEEPKEHTLFYRKKLAE